MSIPYEKLSEAGKRDFDEAQASRMREIRKKAAHFRKIAERAHIEGGIIFASVADGIIPYETTMIGKVLTLDEEYVGIEHKGHELCMPLNYITTLFIKKQ